MVDEMANIYTYGAPAMSESFLVLPDLAHLVAVCPHFSPIHINPDGSHERLKGGDGQRA